MPGKACFDFREVMTAAGLPSDNPGLDNIIARLLLGAAKRQGIERAPPPAGECWSARRRIFYPMTFWHEALALVEEWARESPEMLRRA